MSTEHRQSVNENIERLGLADCISERQTLKQCAINVRAEAPIFGELVAAIEPSNRIPAEVKSMLARAAADAKIARADEVHLALPFELFAEFVGEALRSRDCSENLLRGIGRALVGVAKSIERQTPNTAAVLMSIGGELLEEV